MGNRSRRIRLGIECLAGRSHWQILAAQAVVEGYHREHLADKLGLFGPTSRRNRRCPRSVEDWRRVEGWRLVESLRLVEGQNCGWTSLGRDHWGFEMAL